MHERSATARGLVHAVTHPTRRAGVMVMAAVAVLTAVAGDPGLVGGGTIRAGAAAPELTAGPWIGGPPVALAALRGRVVLLEFWTYG
jgi:hypothetical protein